MRQLPLRRAGWLALAVSTSLTLGGCEKVKPPPPPAEGQAARAAVDPGVEKKAFEASWVIAHARDPAPLLALAGTSEGWQALFTGKPGEALETFLRDAETSPEARIGAARAALELARAHARLGFLVRALTPDLLKAQASRPGAEPGAPWRAYISARLATARGQDAKDALAGVPADSPAAPWAAALAADAQTPLAALLRGQAAGIDAELPPGGTAAYAERLAIRALLDAGRFKEARARYDRLDPSAADILVGEGEAQAALRDPVVADIGARIYAAQVVELLGEAGGWPLLLKADALRILGKTDDALAALTALAGAAPAPAAGLSMLVLSDALGAADLTGRVAAERARLLAEKGDEAGAIALIDALPRDTVAQRVLRAWAGSFVGRVDAEAFPEDRTELSKALLEVVAGLGDAAPGAGSINELLLVERYVDAVQRRFAEALVRMDRPALAVKMRDAAEDKTSAQAPSARNTLSALAAAALDNVGIGRPRVALKYLSRMGEALPAAAGPAEMLRDLLSHRAMQQSGGVTSGQ